MSTHMQAHACIRIFVHAYQTCMYTYGVGMATCVFGCILTFYSYAHLYGMGISTCTSSYVRMFVYVCTDMCRCCDFWPNNLCICKYTSLNM